MTASYGCWKTKNSYVMALKSSDIFQNLKTEEVYEHSESSRAFETQGTNGAQKTSVREIGGAREKHEAQDTKETQEAHDHAEPQVLHDPREPQISNKSQFTYDIFEPIETSEATDNISGRKKSKLQAFKNFFAKKKKKVFLRASKHNQDKNDISVSGFGMFHSLIRPGSQNNMGKKKSSSQESICMLESTLEDSSERSSQDEPTETRPDYSIGKDQVSEDLTVVNVEGESSSSASSPLVSPPDSSTLASEADFMLPIDFNTAASPLACLDTSAARHKMALNPRKHKINRNHQAERMESEPKSCVPLMEEDENKNRQAKKSQGDKSSQGPGPSVSNRNSGMEVYAKLMPDLVPRNNATKNRGTLRTAASATTSGQEKPSLSACSHANVEAASRPKVLPKQRVPLFTRENKAPRSFRDLSREPIYPSHFPRCKVLGLPKAQSTERRSSWDIPSYFFGLGKKNDSLPAECKWAPWLKFLPDTKKGSLGSKKGNENGSSAQKSFYSAATFEPPQTMPFNAKKVSVRQKPKMESPFVRVPRNNIVTKEASDVPFLVESEVPKGRFASWKMDDWNLKALHEKLCDKVDLPQSTNESEAQRYGLSPSVPPASESAQTGLLQKPSQLLPNALASSTKSVRFTTTPPVWPKPVPKASGSKKEPLGSSCPLPRKQEVMDKIYQDKPSGDENNTSNLNFQEMTSLKNPFGVRLKKINNSLKFIRDNPSLMRVDPKAGAVKKPGQEHSDVTKNSDPMKEVFSKLKLEDGTRKPQADRPLEKATAAECSPDLSKPTWITMAKQKQKDFQGQLLAKVLLPKKEAGAEEAGINIEE